MKTILVNYNGKQISTGIKTEWNELDWSDIKFVVEHFLGNIERIYGTEEEVRGKKVVFVKDATFLRTITGSLIVKLWNIKPRLLRQIPGAQLDLLIDEYLPIKFLFEDNKFTKNPLKRVFHWGWYYGPGDDFSTIDFEEYCYADAQWNKYRLSKKEEDLNLFAAILLREARNNYEGIDCRKIFNPQLVETRLRMATRLSIYKKTALWLWWEGCRNKQAGIHKYFFRKSASSKSSGGSLLGLMMAMSKDIFGSFNETKRVNCKVVFARIDQLIKENEEKE